MRRDSTKPAANVDALMKDVERALWAGEDPRRLIPDLVELARLSPPGGPEWILAHEQLAATAAETDPWRASLLSRRVLELVPDAHVAWGALGLAQSLLGNLRYAVRCYERALELARDDHRYAHNLGHLYDVALGQPERAIPLLARAMRGFESTASNALKAEVAASYAHALARAGSIALALSVLAPALAHGKTRDQAALLDWIKRGAPPT